jgi:hypothetical protein
MILRLPPRTSLSHQIRRFLPLFILTLFLVAGLILALLLLGARAEAIVGVLSGWLLATLGQIFISPMLEATKRRQERREAALRELVMERIPRAEQALVELKIFWSWISGKDLAGLLPPETLVPEIFKLGSAKSPREASVPWPFILEVKSWRLLLTEIGPGKVLTFYERLYSNTHVIEAHLYNLGISPATQYVTRDEDEDNKALSADNDRKGFSDALRVHITAIEDALVSVERAAYDALGLSSWEELFPQRP